MWCRRPAAAPKLLRGTVRRVFPLRSTKYEARSTRQRQNENPNNEKPKLFWIWDRQCVRCLGSRISNLEFINSCQKHRPLPAVRKNRSSAHEPSGAVFGAAASTALCGPSACAASVSARWRATARSPASKKHPGRVIPNIRIFRTTNRTQRYVLRPYHPH